MVLHDAVDYWLEGAKMAKYCKSQRLCDSLFVVFTLCWLLTRLIIYPLFPLYSVAFECREILSSFYAWYVFITLLCVLQVLHVFWFYLILRVVISALTTGKFSFCVNLLVQLLTLSFLPESFIHIEFLLIFFRIDRLID